MHIVTRAGQVHINISNNLTTSCLDRFDALLAFNGTSTSSRKLVFKLFVFMCIVPDVVTYVR